MGYEDEDYSKRKEENEDKSEREELRPTGKPGSIMGQTHILSPVSHNGPWTISVLQSMEEAFISHGECLWRWEMLLGEF